MARYSQGLHIDQPLAMLRSATTSYYQADGLGSITSLSNTSGTIAQTYAFDSFGNQTGSSGSLTNPFRYTARESDTETGLYYYRARYYDSTLGRFTGEDPARFIGGENFYRYVRNNPVIRRDPRGLWQVTFGGGLVLGGLLTFGNNSGQWNFGLYSGVGEGVFIDVDPTNSDGCHKFGGAGSMRARLEAGAAVAGRVDATLEDGSDPSGEVAVSAEPIGGVSWSPMKPHEPPHGFLGFGAGLFGGVGFTFHSHPACGCTDQ